MKVTRTKTNRMRKSILLFFALALFTGCERYHVIGKLENENGFGVYMRDNRTGKIYWVCGTQFEEVPLPP